MGSEQSRSLRRTAMIELPKYESSAKWLFRSISSRVLHLADGMAFWEYSPLPKRGVNKIHRAWHGALQLGTFLSLGILTPVGLTSPLVPWPRVGPPAYIIGNPQGQLGTLIPRVSTTTIKLKSFKAKRKKRQTFVDPGIEPRIIYSRGRTP